MSCWNKVDKLYLKSYEHLYMSTFLLLRLRENAHYH